MCQGRESGGGRDCGCNRKSKAGSFLEGQRNREPVRAFLDTNGAHQETAVAVDIPNKADSILTDKVEVDDVKEKWLDTLRDLNVCSQKGLVEMFDGSIGAGSVFMPHGGKYQMTETQAMVAKLPVLTGDCDTVTMMSYGFDPYLSSWSPYHGAVYAVTESVAKIVAPAAIIRRFALPSRNISGA